MDRSEGVHERSIGESSGSAGWADSRVPLDESNVCQFAGRQTYAIGRGDILPQLPC
jgi:hypothetical protein